MRASYGGLKQPMMNANLLGGADCKDLVHALMKTMSQTNTFVNIDDVFTNLRGQYDRHTFEGVIKKLEEDGLIYPTYDEKTYSILS
jgi:hypothetical protein